MNISFKLLPKKIVADLKVIGEQAQGHGFTAYLVGGVVRDVVLGRPSSDWDIVVEGRAIDLAKVVADRTKAKMTVYSQFGTATLVFPDGTMMDFATARREHYPQPGALPIVSSGSIKEDLFRRDFTINTMAVILNPKNFGELQDFYGGYEDLRKKSVRVLHDQSFVDDPTRILRAVRFEGRFGFRIEKQTLALIKSAVKHKHAATVKLPRYFAEFRKIFAEQHPSRIMKRLLALGALDFIQKYFTPSLALLAQLEKRIAHLKKDKFYGHYDWSQSFLIAFFSNAALKQIPLLAKDFHLTKKELVSLFEVGNINEISQKLRSFGLRPSEVYEILDPVDLEIIYFIRGTTSVNIVARRIDQFLKKDRLVSLQITGVDLQKLGFKPGKEMGALLRALLLKKIDGKIKKRYDEITLAKSLGIKA